MEKDRFGDGLAFFEDARFGLRIIKLCKGRSEDRAFYAYVGIEPQNLAYFLKHYQEGVSSDFRVFGRELLRGWGENPPADVIRYMQKKYDVEFDIDPNRILHIAQSTADMIREGWARRPVAAQNLDFPNTSVSLTAPELIPEALGVK